MIELPIKKQMERGDLPGLVFRVFDYCKRYWEFVLTVVLSLVVFVGIAMYTDDADTLEAPMVNREAAAANTKPGWQSRTRFSIEQALRPYDGHDVLSESGCVDEDCLIRARRAIAPRQINATHYTGLLNDLNQVFRVTIAQEPDGTTLVKLTYVNPGSEDPMLNGTVTTILGLNHNGDNTFDRIHMDVVGGPEGYITLDGPETVERSTPPLTVDEVLWAQQLLAKAQKTMVEDKFRVPPPPAKNRPE